MPPVLCKQFGVAEDCLWQLLVTYVLPRHGCRRLRALLPRVQPEQGGLQREKVPRVQRWDAGRPRWWLLYGQPVRGPRLRVRNLPGRH